MFDGIAGNNENRRTELLMGLFRLSPSESGAPSPYQSCGRAVAATAKPHLPAFGTSRSPRGTTSTDVAALRQFWLCLLTFWGRSTTHRGIGTSACLARP